MGAIVRPPTQALEEGDLVLTRGTLDLTIAMDASLPLTLEEPLLSYNGLMGASSVTQNQKVDR
jgi:hypothetical protein